MVRKPKEVEEEIEEDEVEEDGTEQIQDDSVEEEVEEVQAPVVKTSDVVRNPDGTPRYTKAQFQDIIDAYKVQNPAKYELKKDALLAQLKALK